MQNSSVSQQFSLFHNFLNEEFQKLDFLLYEHSQKQERLTNYRRAQQLQKEQFVSESNSASLASQRTNTSVQSEGDFQNGLSLNHCQSSTENSFLSADEEEFGESQGIEEAKNSSSCRYRINGVEEEITILVRDLMKEELTKGEEPFLDLGDSVFSMKKLGDSNEGVILWDDGVSVAPRNPHISEENVKVLKVELPTTTESTHDENHHIEGCERVEIEEHDSRSEKLSTQHDPNPNKEINYNEHYQSLNSQVHESEEQCDYPGNNSFGDLESEDNNTQVEVVLTALEKQPQTRMETNIERRLKRLKTIEEDFFLNLPRPQIAEKQVLYYERKYLCLKRMYREQLEELVKYETQNKEWKIKFSNLKEDNAMLKRQMIKLNKEKIEKEKKCEDKIAKLESKLTTRNKS